MRRPGGSGNGAGRGWRGRCGRTGGQRLRQRCRRRRGWQRRQAARHCYSGRRQGRAGVRSNGAHARVVQGGGGCSTRASRRPRQRVHDRGVRVAELPCAGPLPGCRCARPVPPGGAPGVHVRAAALQLRMERYSSRLLPHCLLRDLLRHLLRDLLRLQRARKVARHLGIVLRHIHAQRAHARRPEVHMEARRGGGGWGIAICLEVRGQRTWHALACFAGLHGLHGRQLRSVMRLLFRPTQASG